MTYPIHHEDVSCNSPDQRTVENQTDVFVEVTCDSCMEILCADLCDFCVEYMEKDDRAEVVHEGKRMIVHPDSCVPKGATIA